MRHSRKTGDCFRKKALWRRCDMSMSEKTRIVILGGGFGGVSMARRLERLCKRRRDVEIILVSRDNFVLMTPLLFEVCSGALDARHCSLPIRAFLRTTRFVGNSGMGKYHGEWG